MSIAAPFPATSRLVQYYQLTKPRVVQLIVFCAAIGMLLAAPGLPPWREAIERRVEGTVAAGTAHACVGGREFVHETARLPVAARHATRSRRVAKIHRNRSSRVHGRSSTETGRARLRPARTESGHVATSRSGGFPDVASAGFDRSRSPGRRSQSSCDRAGILPR